VYGEFADRLRGDRWQPAVDVFETDEAVQVRAEIPGTSAEDLHVNVDGDVLRISGVRKVPRTVAVKRLHQMEIAFGAFERTVRVSVSFERDQVSAHLEDGFLYVTLPKHQPTRRKVEVETE